MRFWRRPAPPPSAVRRAWIGLKPGPIWLANYSPYGKISSEACREADDAPWAPCSSGSLTIELRAPGQYHDRETGWYYNGQRYYIPELYRFNRPEPIGQAGSLDLYMYADGNPVNRVDPTGLEAEDGDEDEKKKKKSWLEELGQAAGNAIDYVNPVRALMRETGVMSEAEIEDATSGSREKAMQWGNAVADAATLIPYVGSVLEVQDAAIKIQNEGLTLSTGAQMAMSLLGAAFEASSLIGRGGKAAGNCKGGVCGISSSCFTAGTLVATVDGGKAIETIIPGELVWSWDETTDELAGAATGGGGRNAPYSGADPSCDGRRGDRSHAGAPLLVIGPRGLDAGWRPTPPRASDRPRRRGGGS